MLHQIRYILFAQFRLCVLEFKAYCYEKVRNYEKFYSSKTLLKMASKRYAYPTSPLDFPLVVYKQKMASNVKRDVLN